jgi:hypothetical protein
MTTDNFCFYLQNRLIQASQTGDQWYSDPSRFSIPCSNPLVAAGRQMGAGSVITNGREPRSCLGRVFNSKLGCFATLGRKCIV